MCKLTIKSLTCLRFINLPLISREYDQISQRAPSRFFLPMRDHRPVRNHRLVRPHRLPCDSFGEKVLANSMTLATKIRTRNCSDILKTAIYVSINLKFTGYKPTFISFIHTGFNRA